MPQQRSASTAAAADRPRLAPPWLLAALASLILVALVAIYPQDDLVRLVHDASGGDVAEAYLANLLPNDPANPRLGLVLARKRIEKGELDLAEEALRPALASGDAGLQREAAKLLWQSLEIRLSRAPENSPLRARLKAELSQRLPEMLEWTLPEDELAMMARKAFYIGNREVGLRIFEHLARANPYRADYWYGEAAREALANGEYRAAAEFYVTAAKHSPIPTRQRKYFRTALLTLQSGDRVPAALDLAGKILQERPDLGNDRETLTLLVTLARAAKRPDLADKYARSLLRLALLGQWQDALLAARGLDAAPRRVALTGDDAPGTPRLPFDDSTYLLSFQAFLDNRKLEDAWQVAASAVRQAPDNLAWRKRLAEVSEWAGRPRVALDHWLHLARTSGQEEAWQAVLRLAPGLGDDDALLLALQHQLAQQPGNHKLLLELVELHERRGDPRIALGFLERQLASRPDPWLLEQMAGLAERLGDDAVALAYWQRYLAQPRPDSPKPAQVVPIAALMVRCGKGAEALALLEKAAPHAKADDRAFWRLTAEVARMQQQEGDAIAAYRRIVSDAGAEETDFEALQWLLAADYPEESARVAVAAWRRFGKPAQLVHALGVYAQRQRWSEAGNLLASLDAGQTARLRQEPDFLRYAALCHQHQGETALAGREMEAALALAPDSADLQQAWLWLLIDAKDAGGLRRALAAREEAWRADTGMHDALAAAYLALSMPDVALRRYLKPRAAEHRDDFLWLMNYADALEQNQESDLAWRLRQYLLADQRRRALAADGLAAAEPEDQAGLRRIARARLVISQRRGDPAAAVLRELLRLDRDADQQLSPAARELAAGWLLETGQYRAERGWLWQQFAGSASRPLWADISGALAEDDRERAGQLLERYGQALPRNDRINAALRVEDIRLAQTDAFETLDQQPRDDQLHSLLTEAMFAFSNGVGAEGAWRNIGGLQEREGQARWQIAVNPGLHFLLTAGRIERSDGSGVLRGGAPDEHYLSGRLAWRHGDGETRLLAEARHSREAYRPLLVEHEQRLDKGLQFLLGLGRELPTADSVALRLAGMKERASLGLRYQATERDRFFAGLDVERYSTQAGDDLGNGRHFRLDYGHALRLGPGNLEAGAFWSDHRYQRHGDLSAAGVQALLPPGAGPNFFLPDDFRFYGLRLSTDTGFQEDYTRAWRPYASVAATRHSIAGTGYDLVAGVAGSVIGADHLHLDWRLTKGGQTTGSLVHQIYLGYRLAF